MGQIGISITMRAAFRDSTQEWSNTYHYGSLDVNPNEMNALDLIDELSDAMKQFHSTAVTFVYGRVWSSGGTPAENTMIAEKALTGVGIAGTVANMDRERAFLVQWDAGVDNRGHKVKLRKWFHACGAFGTVSPTGQLDNTTGFSEATRTDIANQADTVTRLGATEQWGLIAESGRERDGGPPVAHKYLEHHQLGDQWRG